MVSIGQNSKSKRYKTKEGVNEPSIGFPSHPTLRIHLQGEENCFTKNNIEASHNDSSQKSMKKAKTKKMKISAWVK